MTTSITCAARSDFIEKMGMRAQSEGLPRGAGRIFALLVFDGVPIAFGQIAEMLMISRASVSMSVRLLEERGLIRRVSKPADRQDYFEIAPNAFETMLAATRKQFDAVQDDIQATITALPTHESGAITRLTELSGFYRAMSEGMDITLATLRDTRTDQK